MNKVEDLTRIMARLSAGSDPAKIQSDHKDILSAVSPEDIALAGQNLLVSGMFFGDFCSLCRKHLSLIGDPVDMLKKKLPALHPMHVIFEQHVKYLSVLAGLEETNLVFRAKLESVIQGSEFQRILDLHENFAWINRHTEFEHAVLMPELHLAGYDKLVKIISYQHIDLSQSYEGLTQLVRNFAQISPGDFRNRFNSIVQSMVAIGTMHITIEEVVLYPIAVEVVQNPAAWEKCKLVTGGLKQSA